MRGKPGNDPKWEDKLSGTNTVRRRRFVAVVASASIALSGAAWAGCGDDEDDVEDAVNEAIENTDEQVQDAIDAGQEQADEIQGEVDEALEENGVDTEDIEGQVDKAQEDAQDAIDQALEDAQ